MYSYAFGSRIALVAQDRDDARSARLTIFDVNPGAARLRAKEPGGSLKSIFRAWSKTQSEHEGFHECDLWFDGKSLRTHLPYAVYQGPAFPYGDSLGGDIAYHIAMNHDGVTDAVSHPSGPTVRY